MRKYAIYQTKNPKKKMETSKKLLLFAIALILYISAIATIAVFVLGDSAPLEYLIGGVFALASTAYGFYFWKAKNENISKYGNNVDPSDDDVV